MQGLVLPTYTSTWEAESRGLLKFKASLGYLMSIGPAREDAGKAGCPLIGNHFLKRHSGEKGLVQRGTEKSLRKVGNGPRSHAAQLSEVGWAVVA